jgi:outer membrane protein OmpA-like peptidoglycan-associated protein
MSAFDSYHSSTIEFPSMKRWIAVALALSLAFHGGLFLWFRSTTLERFSEYTERLVPRAFTANRLEIDPKLLEPEPEPASVESQTTQMPKVNLPQESPQADEVPEEMRATPAVRELAAPIVNEKPGLESSGVQVFQKIQETARREMNQDLDSFRDQMVLDKPKASSRSLLELADTTPSTLTASSVGAAGVGGMPQFSDLDALLAQSGNLKAGTAPILMPTDLLFEFDKADLRESAKVSLQKLGKLIQRNPASRFSIEGHTDAFGSDEYNQDLSERRASTVADWLVQNMGISPTQITTTGYGSRKLIAPANGTKDQQQINRRVEIVIRAPR